MPSGVAFIRASAYGTGEPDPYPLGIMLRPPRVGGGAQRTMAQRSTWNVGYRAARLASVSTELGPLAVMALLAAALGWTVARSNGFGADLGSAALLTAAGLACLAVIVAGPVACLAAIAALTVSGVLPVLAHPGGVDITIADVFYVGLVGWWLAGASHPVEAGLGARRRPLAFGQGLAILFLAYTGLTLLKVAGSDPGELSDAFVSWLRLVQTASLAWLAATVIDPDRDLRPLLGAILAGALLAIAAAAIGGGALLTQRSVGTFGSPDTLGLASGLVLLIAAFGGLTPHLRYRIPLALAGLLGLVLAKSVASFAATGFAVALGATLASPDPARATRRISRTAFSVALAGVAVFGVVRFLRPEVTPGATGFTSSSTYDRIVVGTAGLEIFERSPVIGVGWRESNRVITDRAINIELRRLFPNANPIFYPDVARTPTSVHNTYIQLLADLGLVGFSLFVALVVAIATRVRELLRRLGPSSELWPPTWVMSLGLVLVIVWVNDNPLFGGEPETVVPALLIGALAATSRKVVANRLPVGEAQGAGGS